MFASSLNRIRACSLGYVLALSVAAASAQTTYYVDDDAAPDGDGSAEYPFDTIQEGINAAADGDTVLVLDGTYFGDGNRDLDFGGRLITVCSENGTGNCIIDCQASDTDRYRAFTFQNGENGSAVLEGFTIINGYKVRGGAIRCDTGSTPTIRDCVFRDNTAAGSSASITGHGGAIYCTDNAGATLLGCTFVDNTAVGGSAIYSGMGGALSCLYSGDTVARDCTFRDNAAIAHALGSGDGGAIYVWDSGHLELTNCAFVGNTAVGGTHDASGLGGALISGLTDLTLAHCTFVGNRREGTANNATGGAWHAADDTNALVLNCTFAGNVAELSGGGAVAQFACSITWVNCQFAGNWAADWGGALSLRAISLGPLQAELINCTLAGNHAETGGGLWIDGFAGLASDVVVNNCVLWGNDAPRGGPQAYVACTNGNPATLEVWYSDSQAGDEGIYVEPPSQLVWGDGNLDDDPLFVGGPSGTWTSDGTCDPDSTQTTFTDAGAAWAPDELIGKFLQPNPEYEPPDPNDPNGLSGYLQSLIVSNTSTTVTVWGDFEDLGTTGASYQVNDYHLMSDSPCIDAGNNTAVPADEVDLDLDGDVTERVPLDLDHIRRFTDRPATTDTGIADEPNYPQVVDMGVYEYGTFGDLGGDCSVGLGDLAELLASYGATVGVGYDHGDLNLDEDVGLSDLAALLSVYGTTCP